MACKSDKLELVKEVAARPGGVNLSAWGTCQLWTPLHVAAHHGSNRLVSYLLGHGAVWNSRDRAGRTPLQLAELAGHTNCAKLLLAHAADQSVLPDWSVEIRRLSSPTDPKLASLEAAVNCKNVDNTAYKIKNYI